MSLVEKMVGWDQLVLGRQGGAAGGAGAGTGGTGTARRDKEGEGGGSGSLPTIAHPCRQYLLQQMNIP